MKRTKKLMGLLLTLVMMLAMSVTAFAEADTHTYELYQIFTGDYSVNAENKQVFSNVKWGQNAAIPADKKIGDPVSEDVLKELTGVNSQSDADKLDVIKKYVNPVSTPLKGKGEQPAKKDDGSVTYSNLPAGYYLIKDADEIAVNDVYTTYVVQVTDGTLTFTRKGDVPTVDKKIVETDGKEVEANEASIGDTVNFEITGTLPSNLGDYREYTYIFTDTLSKGLTYTTGSIKVYVKNGEVKTEVTNYFYKNAGTYSETTGTTLTVGISDLKALNNLTDPKVTVDEDSKIVVAYSAVLNEHAEIAGNGNDNKVKLNYSNDPNDSGEGTTTPPPENPGEPEKPGGETPEEKTITYTTELTIQKTDENTKILTGAEFTLTGNGVNQTVITGEIFEEDTDGTYWKLKDGTYTTDAPVTGGGDDDNSDLYESTITKYAKKTKLTVKGEGAGTEKSVSAFVNDEGKVTFSGLGAGTYTITETVTPKGYNTIEPVTFTVGFSYDDKAGKGIFTSTGGVTLVTDNKLSVTIENHSGSTLPSTGGMGTTIFYILGGVLVVCSGVLLVVRRRMNAKK